MRVDEWLSGLFSWRRIRYHCAMKHKVAWVLIVSCVLAGCSFGMKGLDPQWSGNTEPKCDRRIGLIVADRIIAGALAAGALTALVQNADSMDETQREAGFIVAGGFAATAVIFLISQGVGSGRRSECIAANERWAARPPYNPDNEPAAAPRAVVATLPPPAGATPAVAPAPAADAPTAAAAPPSAAPGAAPVAAPAAPAARSSFFCTSSPSRETVNVCLGDQPACERARQVLGVADLTACAAAQVAWCFDTGGKRRCFGTSAACSAQRAKVTAQAGDCSEFRR